MQILLLEPDVRLGQTYAEALRSQQHSVVVCTNAQDAVCAADLQQPELVIMEIQLTKHSGIEFLYEFRSYPDWQSIPVVIVSRVPAHELAGSTDTLHGRLGVRAYHYKPQTSLRTLLQAVEAAYSTAHS